MEENEKITIESNISDESAEEIVTETASEGHHHHHHHSHHHRHHSHHRSSSSKKKNKLFRFISKNKNKLINCAVAILVVSVLIVIGSFVDSYDFKKQTNTANKAQRVDASSIIIKAPLFKEDVVIVGPAVEEYIYSYPETSIEDIYAKYKGDSEYIDIALPVVLSYSIESTPDGCSVKRAKVLLSENSDLSNADIYTLAKDKTSIKIYNLKTNTKYFYRIMLTLSGDSESSVGGSFKTADTPRILTAQGVGNLRDIGGYKTANGKTVKQGMLYRGCELDGAVAPQYAASAEGISTMLTVLGIRTDMDLRQHSEVQGVADALGVGVKHNIYDSPQYLGVFDSDKKENLRLIFSDLAKKENYPVYLHCTHGMDRTGTICFLLGAVLGVSEEDLMIDYNLSGLYHSDMWGSDEMEKFVNRIKMQQGNSLQEKAQNFLLSVGVTPQEIQSIKEIYLS